MTWFHIDFLQCPRSQIKEFIFVDILWDDSTLIKDLVSEHVRIEHFWFCSLQSKMSLYAPPRNRTSMKFYIGFEGPNHTYRRISIFIAFSLLDYSRSIKYIVKASKLCIGTNTQFTGSQ